MLNVSVIIVTLNRADCMQRCLTQLFSQERESGQGLQVIVVDASADDRTRVVTAGFPGVVYLRNELGYGHMTAGRNIGLTAATGDLIAFVDDDAFARPGWLRALTAAYDDPKIGAVGGRALNRQPNEEREGVDDVGKLKPDGTLSAHFAADTGRIIDVDHMIGCNMSFRRSALLGMGGFREDCKGTEVGEETDACMRLKRLGHRIVYTPFAVVDHLGAPQARGNRFDVRYDYFHRRNNLIVRLRNFGLSGLTARYVAKLIVSLWLDFARRIAAAIARFFAQTAGIIVGLTVGLWMLARHGRDPVRRDQTYSLAPVPRGDGGGEGPAENTEARISKLYDCA
jgi:GT2 family glycosyltransferase